MAALSNPLPSLCWPSDFRTLQIDVDDSNTTGTVNIDLSVGDSASVLNCTLAANADKTVLLIGADKLIRDYLENSPAKVLLLLDGATDYTTLVLPFSGRIDCDAASFCHYRFLTQQTGTKLTHPKAKEYLSLYLPESEDVTAKVTAVWMTDNVVSINTVNTYEKTGASGLIKLDVSPDTMAAPSEDAILVAYTVMVGRREQKFLVRPNTMADGVTDLLFLNSFGQPETFHFFGQTTKEVKPERQSAVFATGKQNYKVETVPEWTAETGLMTDGALAVFNDLISACYAWTADGTAIIITDSDNKQMSARDVQSDGSVTWQEQEQLSRFDITTIGIKLFDKTFDQTFE